MYRVKEKLGYDNLLAGTGAASISHKLLGHSCPTVLIKEQSSIISKQEKFRRKNCVSVPRKLLWAQCKSNTET